MESLELCWGLLLETLLLPPIVRQGSMVGLVGSDGQIPIARQTIS